MSTELLDRYAKVRAAIDAACAQAARPRSAVQLLAVSKFHPVSAMLELLTSGQTLFGENYVQEAQEKSKVLASKGYSPAQHLHMIGPVQRKKAGLVVGNFALVHSLDSRPLADAYERHALAKACVQKVLIEVSIAGETQKAGVALDDLSAFAAYVLEKCPHLSLEGLMCLPPFFAEEERVRPYFVRLRTLAEKLRGETGLPLPTLSMGMSGDFAAAIAEGATLVRIGTAIFGPRPARVR